MFSLITVEPLARIQEPREGQFFMLEAVKTYDPLLKRPFSMFLYREEKLQFLYRIRGKGTDCLSVLKKEDFIQLLGPLGNSYPEPEGDYIVAAGGIGIASVFSVINKYPGRAYLYFGARNRDELVMLDAVGKIAKEVHVTTDDGSFGRKGFVTESLREFMDSTAFAEAPVPVYACGPVPMLKEISGIIVNKGITCHASLEEVMACGIGACLGCVAKTRDGYKRVCKEGPVFNIRDIVWE
jgi:dihydroorotate dehydrogenase electron transfer subunit